MEFIFETVYDQKAVSAMAKALRKTLRKKRSRRSHIFGWIVVILALLLTLPIGDRELVINSRTIITWIATAAIIIVFFFEDKLNAYIARKRMLAGSDQAKTVFGEENYCSESKVGKTEWPYANIREVAEVDDYFVFIFDQSHAQVYYKGALVGGTVEEFREFIAQKIGKAVQKV